MEIGKKLAATPDYAVVSVGAGATLECFYAIRDYLYLNSGEKFNVVVPEHTMSPIYSKLRPEEAPKGCPPEIEDSTCMKGFDTRMFRRHPSDRIPHFVIGPHFEKPNPFLPNEAIEGIEYVQRYSDEEWMKMSYYLDHNRMGVGNSSAANLSVATTLANRGYNVLTIIVEPLRSYYKEPSCSWNGNGA